MVPSPSCGTILNTTGTCSTPGGGGGALEPFKNDARLHLQQHNTAAACRSGVHGEASAIVLSSLRTATSHSHAQNGAVYIDVWNLVAQRLAIFGLTLIIPLPPPSSYPL